MENIFQHTKNSSTWIEQVPGSNTAFNYHLVSYLLMNIFFWCSWFNYGSGVELLNGLLWPLYPTLFGAVALFLHFLAINLLPEKNHNNRSSNKI